MIKQGKLFGEDNFEVMTGVDLEVAKEIAEKVIGLLFPVDMLLMCTVGSVRRLKAKVNDIDFVVRTYNDKGWEQIRKIMLENKAQILRGGQEIIVSLYPFKENSYIQVDFYRGRDNNYGIQKLVRTGSKEHNVYLAVLAQKKGFRLLYSQGLIREGKVVAGEEEEDVFKALGLPVIEPSQREIVNGKPVWMESLK